MAGREVHSRARGQTHEATGPIGRHVPGSEVLERLLVVRGLPRAFRSGREFRTRAEGTVAAGGDDAGDCQG